MEQEVQKDIERFISYALNYAETLLLDSGDYYPFGAKIGSSGEFTPVSFFDDEEYPESQKIINGLTASFEQEIVGNKVRAYCITYDVRVTNEKFHSPIDAILISIKLKEVKGKLTYYYPYKIGSDMKLVFLETWGEHAD